MQLSKLLPRLNKADVRLVAVLHEDIPEEVEEFREFFQVAFRTIFILA